MTPNILSREEMQKHRSDPRLTRLTTLTKYTDTKTGHFTLLNEKVITIIIKTTKYVA